MANPTPSGRIVIEIDPEQKRELYSALALSGITLEDWFIRSAAEYCAERRQLSLFNLNSRDAGTPYEIAPNLGSVPRDRPRSGSHLLGRVPQLGLKKPLTVVSMFSGCGGMDLGFMGGFEFMGQSYPQLPFSIIWANDNNRSACKTYTHNLGHDIACGDVWDFIDELPGEADVLIGGFPCQDISINGKRAGINGPRTGLYRAMVEGVKRIRPKVFVAENVKGLLMGNNREALAQVLSDFGSLGYAVGYKLYRVADYGVPQTRERVIIVGTSSEVAPFTPPEPERSSSEWITAEEAIGDLETVQENRDLNHIWSRANPSPEQGNRRLAADRPGHTIRAECHGNIQFHYSLPRRISMREAARIQSFPDSFVFQSGLRETERQVGNAVPPVFAWHVACSVIRCFQRSTSKHTWMGKECAESGRSSSHHSRSPRRSRLRAYLRI